MKPGDIIKRTDGFAGRKLILAISYHDDLMWVSETTSVFNEINPKVSVRKKSVIFKYWEVDNDYPKTTK